MASDPLRLIDLVDDMCDGRDVFFRLVRCARDAMARDVKVLTLDDTVGTCLAFMKENKIRHVPVVEPPTDGEGKPCLVGVVSERDVFRQVSPYVGKLGQEDSDAAALQQPLVQIVTRNPTCVLPETLLSAVLATMVDERVDMVTVLADGDLVGIVTAGDVVKLFVRLDAIRRLCAGSGEKTRLLDLVGASSGEAAAVFSGVLRTAQDIMTQEVVCLSPDDTLATAIETMEAGRFRHMPIVDGQKRLMGIVSDRDVLRSLPFVGGQRSSRAAGFRGRLFAVDRRDTSLALPLRRVMRAKVVHVLPSCTIYDAAKMLHTLRVSCLPVVDEQKQLRGIVTVTDLMRAMLAAYKLAEGSLR